ncbi:MAG: HAD hydrolase family protein, partial [Cyclobacteriaceae bacterium]|nr:HAD hydrolase family protein [Cyclobacteriaceae bacterium]
GDDINDLKILDACGLSVCPADAREYIKSRVDIVTESKGGQGVARDISDLVLAAKGILDKILKP